MVLSQQFKSDTLDAAAWKRFHELTKQVIALRRGEQQSQRIQLQREQFEHSVKDEMTLAWNVCVDAARGHRDVMDRLRGALNLLEKRKNRDYRDYEADGETLSETVRRAPEPTHSRPESPDESSFVKLSAKDSEDRGCVADQPQRTTPPTTSNPAENVPPVHASRITHHASTTNPTRPTCTAESPESPDESSLVKLCTEDSEDSGCVADQPQRSAPQTSPNPTENITPVHASRITHHSPVPPKSDEGGSLDISPQEEYELCLFRMRTNQEPWDQKKLKRLKSALPPEQAEQREQP